MLPNYAGELENPQWQKGDARCKNMAKVVPLNHRKEHPKSILRSAEVNQQHCGHEVHALTITDTWFRDNDGSQHLQQVVAARCAMISLEARMRRKSAVDIAFNLRDLGLGQRGARQHLERPVTIEMTSRGIGAKALLTRKLSRGFRGLVFSRQLLAPMALEVRDASEVPPQPRALGGVDSATQDTMLHPLFLLRQPAPLRIYGLATVDIAERRQRGDATAQEQGLALDGNAGRCSIMAFAWTIALTALLWRDHCFSGPIPRSKKPSPHDPLT
mmetsp:Transcript_95535/g.270247  ORF Transcript_95535/g.270247 Transcript_95535/m.270247 type:complete len:272 (+) Transcript_95535:423-1238(+)